MKHLLIVAATAFVGAGCLLSSTPPSPAPTPGPGPVACTMEAKLCPDGSAVGRVGPNCEFAPCPPAPSPGPEGRRCSGAGDLSCGAGYECTQECGPPVVRESDPEPGWSCHIKGQQRICPICLAANTMIATPSGEMNVKELAVGMSVWSVNRNGKRVVSKVIRVSSTPAPKTHRVVHLQMEDGRDLWVSPNHPISDGRSVGQLQPGEVYDGSVVRASALVPYEHEATYDFLPDTDTGFYWANGILMGSTLK